MSHQLTVINLNTMVSAYFKMIGLMFHPLWCANAQQKSWHWCDWSGVFGVFALDDPSGLGRLCLEGPALLPYIFYSRNRWGLQYTSSFTSHPGVIFFFLVVRLKLKIFNRLDGDFNTIWIYMCHGQKSLYLFGDGNPPTFNRKSLQWVYKPLLLGWWPSPIIWK